jgi:uncharacterized membrane protein
MRSAVAGLLALGVAATSGSALAAKGGQTEKCAGVIKAEQNDCGTSHSSCHGSIKVDGDGYRRRGRGRSEEAKRHGSDRRRG